MKLGKENATSCGVILTNPGINQRDQIYSVLCNLIGDAVYLEHKEKVVIREVVVLSSSKWGIY